MELNINITSIQTIQQKEILFWLGLYATECLEGMD